MRFLHEIVKNDFSSDVEHDLNAKLSRTLIAADFRLLPFFGAFVLDSVIISEFFLINAQFTGRMVDRAGAA
jgi:hypothetical protein